MNDRRSHTVCLTFDFDALSVWLADRPHPTPAMLSRGEFGARVGVPRILALLSAYDVQATFFVPGHTAESFPETVTGILTAGHEVAHHGYGHEDPSTQTPAEERRSLQRGIQVLERFIGHPPRGYRSPSWDYSDRTLPLLVEHGFLYDSSLFADDYHPYHPRIGDRAAVNQPLQPGQEVDLWEFPVAFHLDDWPYFVFDFGSMPCGPADPARVFRIWAAELDYMVNNEQEGTLTLTMHPQVIGRGHRIAMLERFVHYAGERGARFARLGDVAHRLSAGRNDA